MRDIHITIDLIPTFVYGVVKAVYERSLLELPNGQEVNAEHLRQASKRRLVELETIESVLENDKSEKILHVILKHYALEYIRPKIKEYEFLCDLLKDQSGTSLTYVKFKE